MTIKTICAALTATALIACGGAGTDGGDRPTISNGVLDGVEVPNPTDIGSFPQPVQDTINDFITLNEADDPTRALPSGTANYSGTIAFGFGISDDTSYVVSGDVNMLANFTADGDFDGSVSNLEAVVEEEDIRPVTISGTLPIDTNIRDENKTTFDGVMNGDLTIDGQFYGIAGLLDGTFVGAGGEDAIGQVSGNTITAGGENADLRGYIVLSED